MINIMFTVEEELLINSFNSTTFTYNEERQAYKISNYPLLLEQDIVVIASFPNLKFWSFFTKDQFDQTRHCLP